MKNVLAIAIGIVAVVLGVAFGAYHLTAYFAPKYEAVRRDVMIESRAYSEASIRRLYDLKRQYEHAGDASAKATIAAAARHEFSVFPADRLPSDLAAWMQQIN